MDARRRDLQPTDAADTPFVLSLERPRGRLAGAMQVFGVLLLLAALASIPLTVVISTWRDRQAMRREWASRGPACPVVTEVSLAARGAKPRKPFVYQGVGFAYQIGGAICDAIPESWFSSKTYPVCEFDAPAAIAVTRGARKVVFEPGVGHGATVTIRHGEVSCAVNGALTPRLESSRPG
jgi:hypothetical protein